MAPVPAIAVLEAMHPHRRAGRGLFLFGLSMLSDHGINRKPLNIAIDLIANKYNFSTQVNVRQSLAHKPLNNPPAALQVLAEFLFGQIRRINHAGSLSPGGQNSQKK